MSGVDKNAVKERKASTSIVTHEIFLGWDV